MLIKTIIANFVHREIEVMMKITKHIVIMLMGLNFLVSSIGITFNHHKCGHTGKYSVSIFGKATCEGDQCEMEHLEFEHQCSNCSVPEVNHACCEDETSNFSLNIETFTSNFEFKKIIKNEYLKKISFNIDDILTEHKLKLFSDLPDDLISIPLRLILKQNMRLSKSNDDHIIH